MDALPLPSDTAKVGPPYKEIGALGGSGNYCSYYVARMISTSLSEEELQSHYKGLTLAPIRQKGEIELLREGGSNNPRPILVKSFSALLDKESKWYADYDIIVEMTKRLLSAEKHFDENTLYIISVDDGPYAPNEVRCH